MNQANAAAELIERDAWLAMFEAAPADIAETLGLSHARIGGAGLLASTALPINECNRIMAIDIESPTTIDDIRQARAWFEKNAIPSFAIQVSGEVGDEVRAMLSAQGATPQGNGWAKFVLTTRSDESFSGGATGVDVIEAGDTTAEAFGRVAQAGFGLPPITATWLAALVGRPGWSGYLASVDGEYAGAAAMFVDEDRAWLGSDATLAHLRGRGTHKALIARRVRDAWTAGAKVITAETGQPSSPDEAGYSSFRNYQRSGFTQVYNRPNFKFPS